MPSRVFQVLDSQRTEPTELRLRLMARAVHMDFTLHADESKANRIGLLLRRSHHVSSVIWLAVEADIDRQDRKKHPTRAPAGTAMNHIAASLYSEEAVSLDLDAASDFWRVAPSIHMQTDNQGHALAHHDTEIRMRWTQDDLYFLFGCDYGDLHLRAGTPILQHPTPALWKHDVAEIFIGTSSVPPCAYCEFELSPRGEWLDLRITAERYGGVTESAALRSGFTTAARIDPTAKKWWAFFSLPHRCIVGGEAFAGEQLSVNFFRSQGYPATEVAWQPTRQESFHDPAVFGTLLLLK